MNKLVGPPQPFRVMDHPIDLSLRFIAGIALIVLAIIRFGWLDGALIACVAWTFFPHAPRVPVRESMAPEMAEKMDQIWRETVGSKERPCGSPNREG